MSKGAVNPTVEELCRQVQRWEETAEREMRNTAYYHGLLVQIGEWFGNQAKISDDGSMQDTVICAKVPQLVSDLIRDRDSWRARALMREPSGEQSMLQERVIKLEHLMERVFRALALMD